MRPGRALQRWLIGTLWCVVAALGATPAALADSPTFGLPLDCTIGETCFIQNYVDVDPTDRFSDYRCGPVGYDGHNGTDFRVLPGAEVPVVAMAPGRVLRVRDGVPDRTLSGPSLMRPGEACGNGVVIAHGGGWETISCHLAQNTVAVSPGDQVLTGDLIGGVGLTGNTEFRHVHVRVMRNGETIDPFTGHVPGAERCGILGEPLWASDVVQAVTDAGDTHILAVGFAEGAVEIDAILDGVVPKPARGAAAVVGYGLAMAVQAGDKHVITLEGPGLSLVNETDQPRFQAQAMRFAGRRTPQGATAGVYRVRYQITRRGRVIDEAVSLMSIQPGAQ